MAFRFSRKNGPKKVEKIRLRKGDLVEVLTGKDRSKRGKILEVNRATGRVIVQGVSMIKRHTVQTPSATSRAASRSAKDRCTPRT
jgi:ribosomal protein L24